MSPAPRLVFRPGARDEIREARRWYERQAPGLGRRFLADLDATLARVVADPRSYAVVERTPTGQEVRRALLRRFPYWMSFIVTQTDGDAKIAVLACFHGRRDPEDLSGRT